MIKTATKGRPIDVVVGALESHGSNPKERTDGSWDALCPAHDDEHPSLNVKAAEDGKVLIRCRSQGCTCEAIVKAMGLAMADLFPDRPKASSKPKRRTDYSRCVGDFLYENPDRTPAYRVKRFPVVVNGLDVDKDFVQYHMDASGQWKTGLNGQARTLYRLPDLLEADPSARVYVVEGERKVDALRALGQIATCNSGGSAKGNWRDGFSDFLRGRHVVILPDNDRPGREHADRVARSLQGKAASVKLVELPGLPEKGDIINWLAVGGNFFQLDELASRAKEWAPAAGPVELDATAADLIDAGEPPPRSPRLVIMGDEWFAQAQRDGLYGPDGKITPKVVAKFRAAEEEKEARERDEVDDDEELADLQMAAMVDPLRNADRLAAYLKGRDVMDDEAVAKWPEIDRWAAETKLSGHVDLFCIGVNAKDEAKMTLAVRDAIGLIGPGGVTERECREAFLDLFEEGVLQESGRGAFLRFFDQAVQAARAPAAASNDPDSYELFKPSDFGVRLADVEEEQIDWLAEQRLAVGKIHLTIGPGGVGKSTFVLTKDAALTVGGVYPGGPEYARSGRVAILAAEDGKADTIKPRFVAAGGDAQKIFVLKTSITTKDEKGRVVIKVAVFKDLDYWRRFFDLWQPTKLTGDPIQAFMGRGVNDNRNSEVRDILEPFAELIGQYGVAVEGITHTPKKIESTNAAELAINSVAYPNISRIVHVHWIDPDDEDHYIVTHAKNSLGKRQPPIGYTIHEHRYEKNGKVFVPSKIACDVEPPDIRECDLLNQAGKKNGRPANKIAKAIKFLKDALARGDQKGCRLIDEWVDMGESKGTIFNAKDAMVDDGELVVDDSRKPQIWHLVKKDGPVF